MESQALTIGLAVIGGGLVNGVVTQLFQHFSKSPKEQAQEISDRVTSLEKDFHEYKLTAIDRHPVRREYDLTISQFNNSLESLTKTIKDCTSDLREEMKQMREQVWQSNKSRT